MSKNTESEFDPRYLELNDSKKKIAWYKFCAVPALLAFVLLFVIIPYSMPIPDYEKNIYNTLSTYLVFIFLGFGYLSTVLYYREKRTN